MNKILPLIKVQKKSECVVAVRPQSAPLSFFELHRSIGNNPVCDKLLRLMHGIVNNEKNDASHTISC